MTLSPFQAMQLAVDIVNDSEHDKNKIAACLFHQTPSSPDLIRGLPDEKDPLVKPKDNDILYIARYNQRPRGLRDHFSPDVKIGQSSQFLHAEVACLFASGFATEGASLCVTDPFCPNCAKAICEAGIQHVYIDHKGLDKDFAKRRGDDFESLSLLIVEKAGISVSIIYRKEERLEPLIAPPVITRKGSAQGIEFFDWGDNLTIIDYLKKFRARQSRTAWAIAKIKETNEKETGILVFEELTLGMTPHDYAEKRRYSEKYRLPVDPMNRLLFFCRRKNFTIDDMTIGVNLHPASRALVNAVGYGIKTVYVADQTPDHDPQGQQAADILQDKNLIEIKSV